MDNLRVKRITTDDFDKVMAIRKPEDVYNGFDYLPSYFIHLVNSDNVMAFVAVSGNDFIALDIAFFVDGGEKVVTRAARVSKEYEGRGVMKCLWNHIQNVIKAETQVKYHIYWMTEPSQNTLLKLGQQGYEVVIKKKTIKVMTNKETVVQKQNLGQNSTAATTKLLDQKDLEEMFENKSLINKLFPQKKIVVDWVPYSTLKSNITLIFTQTTAAVYSCSDDLDNILLTFASHFQTIRGIVFNIDVYGSEIDNIVLHLLEHIKSCKIENENPEMLIRFYYDEVDTNDQLTHIGESLTLTGNLTEFGTCFCVEKNI